MGMPKGETAVWGNPFVMRDQSETERSRVTEEYRQWIYAQPELMEKVRRELKGKVLGCWCAPKQCHGNILAEIANSSSPSSPELLLTPPTPAPSAASPDLELSAKESYEPLKPTKKGKKKSQLQTYQALISSSVTTSAPAMTTTLSPQASILHSTTKPSSAEKTHIPPLAPALASSCPVFDIGINLTNSQLKSKWKTILHRANAVGVSPILTGTTIENCKQNLSFCQQWNHQLTPSPSSSSELSSFVYPIPPFPLYCTIGIHPHYASTLTEATKPLLRSFIEQHRLKRNESPSYSAAVVAAVGECGLDFFRNLSTHEQQISAFEFQISLAREFNLPLFVHDREASSTMLNIFRRILSEIDLAKAGTTEAKAGTGIGVVESSPLPPVVIHCFTGNREEMRSYVSLGFYIGITGVICKHQRGQALREMLSEIPLDRLMVETDAPYMGFRKDRRSSEPADVVQVVEEIARVLGRDVEEMKQILYRNTLEFFQFSR
jgi:TatD DNase family protein